jgi:HprK-related kinase A
MFEWAINWSVFTRPNQYLMLHAGVVERGGKALILSGRPGAGKSTLTAALVLGGWRLLSDEVAVIPPGTRNLLPLPRPVSLKEGSIDLVRRRSPDAVIGPLTYGTKKGTVAHLKPPVDSVERAREPAIAAWLVFPWFGAGYETTLQPISRATALLRAGHEAFNYSMLGAAGFETLADLVDGMTCYDLPFSDLDAALEALEALPAIPPPQPGRALVEQVGAHA